MDTNNWLLVGLGNPGEQYRLTRHNIGFLVADELVARWGRQTYREKWQALHTAESLPGKNLHIIKPLTFMNRSGNAVGQYFRFYKIQPDHLLVMHDDLDMAAGRVKLVKGGGAGGHNGIKSIVEALGTADFFRLKIGIGRPGKGDVHPEFPVEKYVLSHMDDAEMKVFSSRIENLRQGIELLLDDQTGKAFSLLNSLK